MKRLGLLILVVLVTVAFSCKNKEQKTQLKEPVYSKEEIKSEVEKRIYPMPTFFEITNKLNELQLPYLLTLCNSSDKVEKYDTEKDRSINMGVYIADLCYAGTYQQQQEVILYINSIKRLLDKLGATAAIDMNNVVEKVKLNINNKEVLIDVLSESFFYAYKFLLDNDRFNTSSLILAGGWVESMYITTNITESSFNNPQIIELVIKQQNTFNKLTTELEKYKDNEDVAQAIQDLKPVKDIFDFCKGAMTEKQMKDFIKIIDDLRVKFVK